MRYFVTSPSMWTTSRIAMIVLVPLGILILIVVVGIAAKRKWNSYINSFDDENDQNFQQIVSYNVCTMSLCHYVTFENCFRTGVGNLQGIAGHIARMIVSARHIHVSCVKSKKSSSENLVESNKKVITSAEAQIFAQNQVKSKKRSSRPQAVV